MIEDYTKVQEGCTSYDITVSNTFKAYKDPKGRPTCIIWTDQFCEFLGIAPFCLYKGKTPVFGWDGKDDYDKPQIDCPIHDMRSYYETHPANFAGERSE